MNEHPIIQESILDVPHIKALWDAEKQTTDPRNKRELHTQLIEAVKVEQIKRGQRTKMSYRRTDKKGA